MGKILCWLGIHAWWLGGWPYIHPVGEANRYCNRCGLEQKMNSLGFWSTLP